MENQEIMEQFSENRQNYMLDNNSMQHLNVNVTSAGCGDSVVGGGVQADMVSGVVSGVTGDNLSVKYDEHHNEEHDVGDDDELKYVKEVQQSEKQQQQQSLKNFGLEADDDGTASYEQNEMAEKEITNASAYHFGNGDAGFVFGENFHQEQTQQQQHHDLFNIGNGHNTNGHNDFSNSHGFEEKLNFESNDMDGFKHETDFSSSTNVTESAEGFEVPQVDVKIEAKPEHQPEMQDEEEPSSLATNTTNGTSSLSENVPAPQAVAEPQHQGNAFDDFKSSLENKENTNPLIPQRPADLDLDLGHSQLNPDAKEFIPSFGSNPASPTSPFNTGEQQNDGVILSETMETQLYFGQAPSAVPRNLLNDDDFVAQSPLKGKGDNDLDAVPMPRALSEFEMEADQRPHELEVEQRDEVMTPDQAIQQLPLDNVDQEPESYPNEGITDYDFLNHGPESCVDNDLDMQPAEVLNTLPGEDDVMKRSIYVANTEVIEDVLNSVQPLPTDIDSVNNSFIEESATESAANQVANDKELLQVEEKEHVSQSASIEEMQMNLRNALNSSNKDIPQLPIDTDSTNNMQESIYMGNEEPQNQQVIEDEKAEKPNKEDEQLHQETEFGQVKHFEQEVLPEQEQFTTKQLEEEVQHLTEETIIEKEDVPFEEPKRKLFYDGEYQNQTEQDIEQKFNVGEERHSADTTDPLISNDSFLNNSFVIHEQQQEINESFSPFKISDVITSVPNLGPLNIDATDNQQQPLSDVTLSPSSTTADEKHLIEDTKEQHQLSMSDLEQQMNELILVHDDDNFSQPDEIVATQVTNTIEDISENLISPDEIAVDNNHDQLQYQEQEKMLINDDESSFNQQMEFEHPQEAEQDEQIEMSAVVNESDILQKSIESPIEQEEHKELESELVAVEEPIIETKQAAQLFTNTQETESETKIEEQPQVDEIRIEPQQQELPPSMVPETAPADFLEPPMELKEETEQQKEQPIVEVASEPINETAVEENTKPEEEESIKTDIIPIEAAVVAATAAVTAAVAATAIAGAKAAASPSQKSETAAKQLVKTSTAAAKPKVSATASSKKPIDVTKKSLSLAAKPRGTAAPTKTATAATAGADKKPITKPTTSTTTTARKPLSATGTTASKVAAKPASTTSSARTATTAAKSSVSARPTTALRTVTSSTTTRKPATTSSTTATTNAPTARSRPATAPPKPTTLGLSAANSAPKTKPSSPRATLTSQVRKTAPATTAAKSPVKSTAANGVNKTVSSSLTSRTKTTTSTASSTAPATGTKTFTARPAPKFTHSSSSTTTTTSTRRLTVGGTTTATSTTTMTTKTSSTPLRKSSPHKLVAGRTPTKSTTAAGALKSKTPVSKTASPAAKPAPIRKPADKTANVSNNESTQIVNKQLNGDLEAVKQTVEQQQQQNGDTSIPMQNEEQPSLLEEAAKDGQMDAMNA